jgi:hypothetical protein
MALLDTLVTAGVGGLAGGIGGYYQNEAEKARTTELLRQLGLADDEIMRMSGEREAQVQQEYSPLTEGYGQNFQDYMGRLQDADFSRFDVQAPGDFQYDVQQESQQYMNPALQQMLDTAVGSVQGSAANRGKLFSGATGRATAQATGDIQARIAEQAMGRAERVGQQKYQQFRDKFQNTLQASQANKANLLSGLNTQGQAVGMQGQQFGTQQNLLNQIRQGADAGIMQNLGTRAQTRAEQAGQPSGFGAVMQGVAGGLG